MPHSYCLLPAWPSSLTPSPSHMDLLSDPPPLPKPLPKRHMDLLSDPPPLPKR
jgi:hypothetical protein